MALWAYKLQFKVLWNVWLIQQQNRGKNKKECREIAFTRFVRPTNREKKPGKRLKGQTKLVQKANPGRSGSCWVALGQKHKIAAKDFRVAAAEQQFQNYATNLWDDINFAMFVLATHTLWLPCSVQKQTQISKAHTYTERKKQWQP